jgi:hypothetical protein
MRTSNLSPKKLSHRSRNRTPKLYRWADIGTEALIYFTVLWGPWAFGTVHDWAITTMNFANYGIGLLLLTKWIIRWKTDYQPARWTSHSQNGGESDHPKRDWRTKTIGFLTVYMLGYILVSILNARSTYNWDFNFFEYEETYIKWLPHTYDKAATIQSFCNFLGLAFCFWGVRDWLLGKTRKERTGADQEEEFVTWHSLKERSTHRIPFRLYRLIWLLCLSGGLLALIGIIQRLDGTQKLLWIYDRDKYGSSTQSFGPFGYRSNGISYLNLILPIAIGFFLALIKLPRKVQEPKERENSESYLLLAPTICMLIVAPIVSLSRGGVVVLLFLLGVEITSMILNPKFFNKNQKIVIFALMTSGIVLSYFIGWDSLLNRLKIQNSWHETKIEKPNYGEIIHLYIKLPSSASSKDSRIFFISDTQTDTFRKASYNASITKDGYLTVTLHNDLTKSGVSTVFTNFVSSLKNDTVELEISRTNSKLQVKANEKNLIGVETRYGNTPPTWNHPLIPNEILLYNSVERNNSSNHDSSLFRIEPLEMPYVDVEQNTQSFELESVKYLTFGHIIKNLSKRNRIYEGAIIMAKDNLWLGCGSGAWATVYFLYHKTDEPWDAWAHCDWIEYLTTFGLCGSLPIFIMIGLLIAPIQSSRTIPMVKRISFGINLAIAGCLLHAVIDFPLQVMSIMHVFVTFCSINVTIRQT